ncbi:MAG TPA: ABC transporter permease [Gemmatimonadaceae bacterium]|nr:ABC transporter permease [Gemmatimonadaceae bacterium]
MTVIQRLRYSRFWPMLWKEFIQMRRDRLTFLMMTGLPAIQLLLFGYAIQTDVRHLKTVVLDESRTAESRALVTVMANTGNFDVIGQVANRDGIRIAIENGEANAALVIPPDYARDVMRGRTATAQMIVDAADPQSSAAAISGAQLAAQVRATQIVGERLSIAPPLDMRVRPWFNPAQRSAVFIVPGVIGILLTITMTLIAGIAVVRERERGTLEQLVVTPIGKTSLMLGKLIPFVVVGYVQMTVVMGLGKLIFDIPVRGSVILLYALTVPFIVASLGVGLFISTFARNQGQAMQLAFFFMLPNILLSGYIFPRMAMPEPAQWIGLALPLTYYLKVLRGILLKGVGFGELWRPTAALVALALVLLAVSVRRFTKTID